MIGQKRAPGLLLPLTRRLPGIWQILGDGIRGWNIGQAESDQLIVDALWTPEWILAMDTFDHRDGGGGEMVGRPRDLDFRRQY